MIGLVAVSLIMGLVYSWLIRWIYLSWWKIEHWILPSAFSPKKKVTVVISARNEAENILLCLNSLLIQSYPKDLMEIIVVDDYSEDDTLARIHTIEDERIKSISLKERYPDFEGPAFKKKALSAAIAESKGDIILTIDADCQAQKNWIRALVSCLDGRKLDYVTGPVILSDEESRLERFQSLENLALNAVTAVGINSGKMLLSFGANSAFSKAAFVQKGGYQFGENLASGDDIFLVQNIASEDKTKVGFCKNDSAVVSTKGLKVFEDLFQQRIRWAAKYKYLEGGHIKGVMVFILAYCLLLILLPIAMFFTGLHGVFAWIILLFFKLKSDFWLLRNLSKEFNKKYLMNSFIHSFVFYPALVVMVGLRSLVNKNYIWKGRKVS